MSLNFVEKGLFKKNYALNKICAFSKNLEKSAKSAHFGITFEKKGNVLGANLRIFIIEDL